VVVDGRLIFSKRRSGDRFPEHAEILAALKK
jgi:hypothetical protein